MNIRIDKSFDKDTSKLRDKILLNRIRDCIINAREAKYISDIKGIKKLTGFEKDYRIKLGDYRVGIIIENDIVEFIRCLHRKDIYKYFPK